MASRNLESGAPRNLESGGSLLLEAVDATAVIPTATLILGRQPVTASGSGTVARTVPLATVSIGRRPVTAAASGTASVPIPRASLRLGAQPPFVPHDAKAILTCEVLGPALRRIITGPEVDEIGVTGPTPGPIEDVSGPATSRTIDGPAVITRMIRGPSNEACRSEATLSQIGAGP